MDVTADSFGSVVRFSQDDSRVVDGSYRPLVEWGLIARRGWKRGDDEIICWEEVRIIKRILSTMKHPKGKIPIRKLHSILINTPKRSSIHILYSRKSTTWSCIGFKHVKRFANLLSDQCTVEVGLDEVNCRGVGCVGWEDSSWWTSSKDTKALLLSFLRWPETGADGDRAS